MTFNVAAEAYDRFMGVYSSQLSPQLVDLAGVRAGQRALDVGCGPGALTHELVTRLGADAVAALDPSPPFVAAARERFPGVDVREASAEELPFAAGTFDAALAQLVVHFMADPAAGLAEMARVTRAGGVVAACIWDHGGGQGPLSTFWQAARELDADATDESKLPGARDGHLAELFTRAGLGDVEQTTITARRRYATFDDWWEPYLLGAGPAGAYAVGLDEPGRRALRDRCRALLPAAPFELAARAWAVRGVVSD